MRLVRLALRVRRHRPAAPDRGLALRVVRVRVRGHGRAHDAACLRAAVTGVEAHCGRYSDYGLKHVRTLNNLCNAGFSGAQIEEAAEAACV